MEGKIIIKKLGIENVLAEEIVKFLKEKEVTYGEAIQALRDAQSFWK